MTRLTTVPFIHAPVQSTSSHVTLPTEPQSGKDMDYPSFRWGHRLRCFYLQNKSVVTQLCLTLCDPMGCSPPRSSVHGILQARTLEWGAMLFSRGSSWPRDQTHDSCISYTGRWVFTTSATFVGSHIYNYLKWIKCTNQKTQTGYVDENKYMNALPLTTSLCWNPQIACHFIMLG